MQKCIISANCQGFPLAYQLANFRPFTRDWDIEIYVNFQKQYVPEEKLKNCGLLIYQRLDDSWGDLAESSLLSRVSKKAKVICMPNISNFTLWPMARTGDSQPELWKDKYIDMLIERGHSLEEIIYLGLKADLSKIYNLPRLRDNTLNFERNKKYGFCDEICDYIETNYKQIQIFTTPNHPHGPLLNYVAKLVLEGIGYRGVPDKILDNLSCDEDFYLPIHPSIARFLELEYGDEKQTYPAFGKNITYKEYLVAYTLAKQHNIPLAYYFMEAHKK